MQWRMPQDLAAESFGMPIGLSTYNPYWGEMQWGMDGYMAPYGNTMPYMGLTPDPFALPLELGWGDRDTGCQEYLLQRMQWRMPQDLAAESFGMPIGPSTYNPYWGGMQWGMDGYMAPYGNTMLYMGLP